MDRVLAIKMYRAATDCPLSMARKAIDELSSCDKEANTVSENQVGLAISRGVEFIVNIQKDRIKDLESIIQGSLRQTQEVVETLQQANQ